VRSFTPKEVLSSPVFWLLYVMFVMVSASGLMATAQIAVIASDLNVGSSIVFFGATTPPFAPLAASKTTC